MIHILHPQTGKIVGYLDNNGERIYRNDLHEQHVGGLNAFRFTMNSQTKEAANVEGRARVLIPGERSGYQEFVIYETAIIDGDKEVFTTGAEAELDKQKIIVPDKHEALTLKQYVELALTDTEYTMGDIVYKDIQTIEFEKHLGAFTFLSKVAQIFNVEPVYRVEIRGNRIIGRYVDMVEPVGNFYGKEIEYGKDLVGIKKTSYSDRIVTSLLTLGPIKPDGTRLSVTVTDNDAFQRWGRNGNHIVGIYEVDSDNIDLTPDQLSTLGRIELKKRIDSVDEFIVEAAIIENIFPNERTFLGDKVRVKNTEYEPALYAEARILSVQRSISDRSVKKFLIGNVVEYERLTIKTPTQRPIKEGCPSPKNPREGEMWIDTCNEPSVLKKYTCQINDDPKYMSPEQAQSYQEYIDGGMKGTYTWTNPNKTPYFLGFLAELKPNGGRMDLFGTLPPELTDPYRSMWASIGAISNIVLESIEFDPFYTRDMIDGEATQYAETVRLRIRHTEDGVPNVLSSTLWNLDGDQAFKYFGGILKGGKVCSWKPVGQQPDSYSPTAPESPNASDIWFDTSGGATPVMKRYDGSTWEKVTPTTFDELTGTLDGEVIDDSSIPLSKLEKSVVTGIKKFGGTTTISGDVELEAGTGITIVQDDTTKKLTFSSSGGSGDDTTIQGVPVPAPTSSDDEKLLAYDNETQSFKYVTPPAGTGGTDASSIQGKAIPAPTVMEDEMVLAYDNETNSMKWVPPGTGSGGTATPTKGAIMSRLNSAMASAMGARTVTFDTVVKSDQGFICDPTAGTITIPETGWYLLNAHVRLTTQITGFHTLSVTANGVSSIRGTQMEASTIEAVVSGVDFLQAGAIIRAEYFSGSTTVIDKGVSSYTTLRVLRVGESGGSGGGGTAGVSSIRTPGGSTISGDVELVAGEGVTLTQDDVLKQIVINSSATMGGDAISIQGIPVDATSTIDGFVLTYDSVLGKLVLKPKPSGGGEGTVWKLKVKPSTNNLNVNLSVTTHKLV